MKKTRSNRRKNNMNPTKIGVIFIISALALAGVGIGYSAWTDTITIDGTVSTGDVDINVVDYSGTWVWKVYGHDSAPPNEIYVWHGFVDDKPTIAELEGQFLGCTVEPISKAYAEQTVDAAGALIDDAITVIYDNLFPCIDFKVDYLFYYDGSIPARINVTDPFFTGDDADFFNTLIWTLPGQYPDMGYCYGEMWTSNADGEKLVNIADLEGYQLHEDDYILLVITLHLAQDNDLMNMDASFTAGIEVVQWNEYPYDGGECGEDPPIGLHADVMLCMDRSGSIDDDPLVPPIWRAAAKGFITALLTPDDGMIGVASFAALGSLDHVLSINEVTLHQAIDDLGIGGGTNLADGIYYARTELEVPNDRTPDADYPDYIVIITDGEANLPSGTAIVDAETQAAAAKAHGIKIFVFGIGSSLSPTTRAWLQNTIASSPGDYYEGDWSALADLLESLVII